MTQSTGLEVGVVVERKRAASPWVDYVWRPVAIMPERPAAPPWTKLQGDEQCALFYAGAITLILHRTVSEPCADNLRSQRPAVWIAMSVAGSEPPTMGAITMDPAEADALAETAALVEEVRMPEAIRAVALTFVEERPVDGPFQKRERRRPNQEALARPVTRHGRTH
jgi:hypothetical protein